MQQKGDFVLPRGEPVQKVAAWKDHVGLNYHAYTMGRPGGPASKIPIRYPEESAEQLVLSKAGVSLFKLSALMAPESLELPYRSYAELAR